MTSDLPVTRPRPKKWSSTSPKNVETSNHRSFTRVSDSGWIRIRCTGESPDHGGPLFVGLKLAVACVGKRPKDDAGILIYGLTKVHGEGENNDKKEEIDAKERMQQSAEGFRREHVEVHPYEGDDGENAKRDDDDSGEAF